MLVEAATQVQGAAGVLSWNGLWECKGLQTSSPSLLASYHMAFTVVHHCLLLLSSPQHMPVAGHSSHYSSYTALMMHGTYRVLNHPSPPPKWTVAIGSVATAAAAAGQANRGCGAICAGRAWCHLCRSWVVPCVHAVRGATFMMACCCGYWVV